MRYLRFVLLYMFGLTCRRLNTALSYQTQTIQILWCAALFATVISCTSVTHAQKQTSKRRVSSVRKSRAEALRVTDDETRALFALSQLYAQQRDGNSVALELARRALARCNASGNQTDQAIVLNQIGDLLFQTNPSAALEDYQKAASLAGDGAHQTLFGKVLSNIADVFSQRDQFSEALLFYRRALAIELKTNNMLIVGNLNNDLGTVYQELGDPITAFHYYKRAVIILERAQNKHFEVNALKGLINVSPRSARTQLLYSVISTYKSLNDNERMADTYVDLANAYLDMGNAKRATKNLERATTIYLGSKQDLTIEEHRERIMHLRRSYARAYDYSGDSRRAAESNLVALSISNRMALLDPVFTSDIQFALMDEWNALGRKDLAIIYGKNAVNNFELLRQRNLLLPNNLQQSFLASRATQYRELAELLMQADYLVDAETILDLIKIEELRGVVRGNVVSVDKTSPLALSTKERSIEGTLSAMGDTADDLVTLEREYAQASRSPTHTDAANEPISDLRARIEGINAQFDRFIVGDYFKDAMSGEDLGVANKAVADEHLVVGHLQAVLASMGPGVIGIRILVAKHNVYELVVTAHTRQRRILDMDAETLERKVGVALLQLRDRSSNPKPILADLYSTIINPLRPELDSITENARPDHKAVILWSLDGVLRLFPIAALYDGRDYLVQKYDNVRFTSESYSNLAAESQRSGGSGKMLAMGLSKSFYGMPSLPGVVTELKSIVHDPDVPGSRGPYDGTILTNEQFTFYAWQDAIARTGSYSVVHIASHFALRSGTDRESFLLLGGEKESDVNGYRLTLARLEASTISFDGVQLVTLSACHTAETNLSTDGVQVESLGMIVERKRANAVLATLWDVNDLSTSELMQAFYGLWSANHTLGKGEALRRAQVLFINRNPDQVRMVKHSAGSMSVEAKQSRPTSDYSHPYYWAPFILTGDFR